MKLTDNQIMMLAFYLAYCQVEYDLNADRYPPIDRFNDELWGGFGTVKSWQEKNDYEAIQNSLSFMKKKLEEFRTEHPE